MYVLLFGISGGEVLVILLVVLLLFGSKGIPDIARTLGRTMRQLRDASDEVQREIQRGANDVRRTWEEQRRTFADPGTPPAPPRCAGAAQARRPGGPGPFLSSSFSRPPMGLPHRCPPMGAGRAGLRRGVFGSGE